MPPEPARTRFAPSPTGLLHLGHAYSALIAEDRARRAGGTFLLRIEDIDGPRCKPAFETAIFDDLHWLGLTWPTPVMRQSERFAAYDAALERLAACGLCYPCRCTRRDIRAALSAPQGQNGEAVYPGTCRGRNMRDASPTDAIRLDMARALDTVDPPGALEFHETGPMAPGRHALDGADLLRQHGDVVLARRDIGTSYHIAVVVDDAAQRITEVTRGYDLFDVTPLHRLLQALLDLPTPAYHHHALIRDADGRRLAKRDDSRAIRHYREAGASAADIRGMVGFTSSAT